MDNDINNNQGISNDGNFESSLTKEINHLKTRVERIVNVIKLSPGGLSTPSVWEENCVNAVNNCIHEWRMIVSFHKLTSNYDEDVRYSETTISQIKSVSLDVFMLTQQALQVGPLSGSRPAYFKRCGSEVAKIAYNFLTEAMAGDVCSDLLFTDRQRVTLAKWIHDAEKAAESNHEPSKTSNLKQMQIKTGIKTKKIFKK